MAWARGRPVPVVILQELSGPAERGTEHETKLSGRPISPWTAASESSAAQLRNYLPDYFRVARHPDKTLEGEWHL